MPFININGQNTHYLQTGFNQSDQTTIIFVHGAGGTGKNWAYQLAGIDGYNKIALDLPGHGRSEGSPSEAIELYREFIWGFVQALGIDDFVVAGHSMGGAIAMELALAYPDSLKGLIIIDSGARLRVNSNTLELLTRGEHALENVKYSYSKKTPEKVLSRALEEMKQVPTEIYLADFMACNGFNIMDRLKAIDLPTLVICGEDDQMTPVKYSEYLAQELPLSITSIIENAGHMSMLEQPDSVNKAIQNYLEALCNTCRGGSAS